MRAAARMAAAIAGGVLVVGGLAGCGGDDDGGQEEQTQEQSQQESPEQEQEEQEEQEEAAGDDGADGAADGGADAAGSIDGTWEPINDSPIETLTISGEEVETTGTLACPGTLSTENGETRLELDCETPDESRSAGTVELDPDGTHLIITWDGPEWGGMIDSLTRAG